MGAIVRSSLWLSFFAAILLAWYVMFTSSLGMDLDLLGRPGPMAEVMRGMDPNIDMAMPMAEFFPLWSMWAIMMAAMMLPTLVPTLRAYEDLMTSAGATRGGWAGVVIGYLGVWVGFAGVIAALQLGLLHLGVIDMLGIASAPWIAGVLLIVVGLFQFTRAKEICHGICHSPSMYFITRWKQGLSGGVQMGSGLGLFCVVCCWGFMALGFVGGVMNLTWMGLATLFMVIEKLSQIGDHVTKPMGLILFIAGCGAIAWPVAMGG
jgi:predicted metal-binding membrane protein